MNRNIIVTIQDNNDTTIDGGGLDLQNEGDVILALLKLQQAADYLRARLVDLQVARRLAEKGESDNG